MSDQWTDRLSELVDGDLAGQESRALERHLAECAECAATLGELRRVVRLASALEDRPPAADLWPAIAARIGVRPAARRRPAWRGWRRRVTLSVPQLAAAAIALMMLSGGAVWVLAPGGPGTVASAGGSDTASATRTGPDVALVGVTSQYDLAVGELEAALAAGRHRLDTATVRVIETNLRVIDGAIAQARTALAADPANQYLYEALAESMRRKVKLLQQATLLAAASS